MSDIDSNSLPEEEHDEFDFSKVTLHRHPREVSVVPSESSERRLGWLWYTEGLIDVLGFEMVTMVSSEATQVVFDFVSTARRISEGHKGTIVGVFDDWVQEQFQDLNIPAVPYAEVLTYVDGQWVPEGDLTLFNEEQRDALVAEKEAQFQQELQDRSLALVEEQRQRIKEHGFGTIGVFDPEGEDPSFVYSVGLSGLELPELFISGRFEIQDLSHLVNQVAEFYKTQGRVAPVKMEGHLEVEIDGEDCEIHIRAVEADAPKYLEEHMTMVQIILEYTPKVVYRIELSDAEGRFPGEEGFVNTFSQFDPL